jgi:hypothetical protein
VDAYDRIVGILIDQICVEARSPVCRQPTGANKA